MKFALRKWCAVVAASLSFLMAPAATTAAPLTLAVSHGPVSLLVYVAESRQYFKDEGLDVRLLRCLSGRECLDLMERGLAQAATAADFAVVSAALGGSDVAIFASISGSTHQIKLVGKRGTPLSTPADTTGKRFGTVEGTSAEYFLSLWLERHGLTTADVNLVHSKPDQLPRELHGGRVDAITVWEPHASRALSDLGAEGVEWPTAGIYFQHFVLAAARPTLSERRQDLVKLLTALRRAEGFVANEPESAWRMLSTRLGMQPLDAQRYLSKQDFRLRLDASLAQAVTEQAKWVLKRSSGAAPIHTLAPRLIDADLMLQVAPKATTTGR
jgi:ABC-type nitrate/sulfonate/bicarbonate transport system substrate-binding protein